MKMDSSCGFVASVALSIAAAFASSAAERVLSDGGERVIECRDYYTEHGDAWPGLWHLAPSVVDWRPFDRIAVEVVNETEGETRFCWGLRMADFSCGGEQRIGAYSHRLLAMPLSLPEGKAWPPAVSNLYFCVAYPHAGAFKIRNAWLLRPGEALPGIDEGQSAEALKKAIFRKLDRSDRRFEDVRADTYGLREHFEAYLAFRDACEKAGQRGGILVGKATSMEKIMPRGKVERPLEPADALSVRLAKGEYESVQFLVAPRNGRLKNVKVRVDGLRRSDGCEFACSNVLSAVVGYVRVSEQAAYKTGRDDWTDGRYRRRAVAPGYGWYPDPIMDDLGGVDIAATDVQSFWLRFHAERSQQAGIYRGVVTVTADGEAGRSVPISVRVNAFELPATSPLPTMITFSPWFDSSNPKYDESYKAAMTGPDSPIVRWRSRKREWCDFLADYYITMDTIYLRNDSPDVDSFRRLKGQGRLGLVNIGNWNFFKDGDEANWREKTLRRLKTSYGKIKSAGLESHAYLYGADEVSSERLQEVSRCVDLLRKEFPGVPIATTAYDHSLGVGSPLTNVSWFVVQLNYWNPQKAKESRELGHKVWWYTCNVPANEYPNMFLESQAIEARLLQGALAVKYRPDGFLMYQIADWKTPTCTVSGPFTDIKARTWGMHNGEGCWTCVGRGGRPLPTLRLENFRDGLEDLAYAKLLEARLENAPGDQAWVDSAKRLLAVPESVAKSLTDYSDDPQSIYAWRDAMADLLE
ncbi:MAG: DUF4091 domain-containing protein [Kiritimatiellae bacterium]|nr:DUF4091 domain-containing protein [Kiritimatiellia bacterium]